MSLGNLQSRFHKATRIKVVSNRRSYGQNVGEQTSEILFLIICSHPSSPKDNFSNYCLITQLFCQASTSENIGLREYQTKLNWFLKSYTRCQLQFFVLLFIQYSSKSSMVDTVFCVNHIAELLSIAFHLYYEIMLCHWYLG